MLFTAGSYGHALNARFLADHSNSHSRGGIVGLGNMFDCWCALIHGLINGVWDGWEALSLDGYFVHDSNEQPSKSLRI
jgi:hypothetical protein